MKKILLIPILLASIILNAQKNDFCTTCQSNPAIFPVQQSDCTIRYQALIELPDCVSNVVYDWVFSSGETSDITNPIATPTQNGPFDATLNLTYTLQDGTQCMLSGQNQVTVSCVEETICGICDDTEGDFPLVSDSYVIPNFGRVLGKTVTSDCSGNIYSLGHWDGNIMLNKYDLNGNLLWGQNINLADQSLLRNLIMEVDDNESIYIKHNRNLYKYNSNGTLAWQININDTVLAPNIANFTINNSTGDLYLPINSSTTLTNVTTGNSSTFNIFNTQSSILRIDTNSSITNLGAFIASRVLNLHYNNGLKSWSRNNTGIEYRQYSPNTDVLDTTNVTWLDNNLINSFDGLTPLFYNHINDEVYTYTGNILASNNDNTRILSIDAQNSTVNANILLPEALYIGQHLGGYQAAYSFNDTSGELAIYADNFSNSGSSLISTISSDDQLDTKFLTPFPSTPNPFYSRSFHGITYGGDCLYFYGQYRSATNVILDGGITLPASGTNNNLRSVIIRLQDDLEIRTTSSQKAIHENQVTVNPNPVKNDNIHLEFKKHFQGKITFLLYDFSGNLVAQENGVLDKDLGFNFKINRRVGDRLFLKIIRDDGYTEVKNIIVK